MTDAFKDIEKLGARCSALVALRRNSVAPVIELA